MLVHPHVLEQLQLTCYPVAEAGRGPIAGLSLCSSRRLAQYWCLQGSCCATPGGMSTGKYANATLATPASHCEPTLLQLRLTCVSCLVAHSVEYCHLHSCQ